MIGKIIFLTIQGSLNNDNEFKQKKWFTYSINFATS